MPDRQLAADAGDTSMPLSLETLWRRHKAGAIDFSLSMAARAGGAPIALLANILIARALGPTRYGEYLTLLSVGLLSGGIAAYGVGPVLTREIAAQSGRERPEAVRTMSRWAIRLTAIVASFVVVGAMVWLSSGKGVPHTDWLERISIVAMIIGFTWMTIASGILGGLSEVPKSLALGNVLKNSALVVALALLLIAGTHEVGAVLWAQSLSLGLAVFVGFRWASGALGRMESSAGAGRAADGLPQTQRGGEWTRAAGHFFAMSAGVLLLGRFDVVLVNAMAGSRQAGLYGAAARLGQVLGIAGLVWIAWLQPRIAAHWNQSRQAELKRSLRIGLEGSVAMTVTLAIVAWVFAAELVGLMGPGFGDAVWPFRVILLGYIIWACSVPYYVLLTMSGRERLSAWVIWFQLGITLAASLPLISEYGAMGGAIASSSGLSLASLGIVIIERYTRARQPRLAH